MPKKFEGHAIKFFGTLKTNRDWLFHGHVNSKKCNVFSHGHPPPHTGLETCQNHIILEVGMGPIFSQCIF